MVLAVGVRDGEWDVEGRGGPGMEAADCMPGCGEIRGGAARGVHDKMKWR